MYEQQVMDLRLDYEKTLKDNLIMVADFAGDQRRENLDEEGRPLKEIKSKQEAYGIMAQEFLATAKQFKMVKSQMDDFLKLLEGDAACTTICGTIYNSAIMLAIQAVVMASEAKRIISDMYYDVPTPIEQELEEKEDDFKEVEE